MAENMPVMQEQVRTDASVGSGSQIAASLADFAQAPTVLGVLGQNLASSASRAWNEQRGYELAQNPKGELLPAITSADKAFNDAYMAQAGTTLGLQAQQLMGKASLELESSYKLSQQGIEAFHSNVNKGLQGILDLAPTMLKPRLEAQYKNALDNETLNYLGKMQSQQKQIAKEESFVYESTQTREILNNNLSGTKKGMTSATEAYQNGLERINQRVASGQWTPRQGEAATLELQEKYYSSRMQAGLLAAQSEKKEAEYLANLPKQKPDDVPWDIYLRAMSSTVAFQGQTESLRARYENEAVSSAIATSRARDLTALELSELQEKVSPARYQNFIGRYISQLGAKRQNTTDQNEYANPTYWAGLTQKQQNQMYDKAVEDRTSYLLSTKPRMSEDEARREAEIEAAVSAGGIVPKFMSKLSNQIGSSTNPDVAISAIQQYKKLSDVSPFKAKNLDPMAKKIATKYLTHAGVGEDPNIALARARQLLEPINEEQNNFYRGMAQKNIALAKKTPVSQIKFAKEYTGLPLGDMAPGAASLLANNLMSVYSDLYVDYRGDEDAIKEHIKEEVKGLYGNSYANGVQELVRLPIEDEVGVYNPAVIQEGLYNHLSEQFAIQKKAYDEGFQDVYYQLKPRIAGNNEEQIIQKTEENYKKLLNNPNLSIQDILSAHNDLVKLKTDYARSASSEGPVVFDEVHRNGSSYPRVAQISYDPLSGETDSNGKVIGGRAISVIDDKGRIAPLYGAFGGMSSIPNWMPDAEALRNRAAQLQMKGIELAKPEEFLKTKGRPSGIDLITAFTRPETRALQRGLETAFTKINQSEGE